MVFALGIVVVAAPTKGKLHCETLAPHVICACLKYNALARLLCLEWLKPQSTLINSQTGVPKIGCIVRPDNKRPHCPGDTSREIIHACVTDPGKIS